MAYHLEIISLENAIENSAIAIFEDPLAVHLPISEVAFVLMTLNPFVNTHSVN